MTQPAPTSAPDALLKSQVSDAQFEFLSALMASPAFSVAEAEASCGLAAGTGGRWLRIDKVRQVLGELLRARRDRHEDVRSSVLLMLWRMACADPRGAYAAGAALPPDELPNELAAVVTEVTPILHEGQVVTWKYKFESKTAILKYLLQHFDAPKDLRDKGGLGAVRVVFRGVSGDVVTTEDEDES